MISRSGWKAGVLVAGLVAGGAGVAGCASGTPAAAPMVQGSDSASGIPSPGGSSPEQQASNAEFGLLRAFASIPGAKQVQAPQHNATGTQLSETWQLNLDAKAAFAAAAARLPHWKVIGTSPDGTAAGGQYERDVQTSGGTGTLATQSVELSVSSAGAQTDVSTLQVNVVVNYRPDKPAAEHVPDSAVLVVTTQAASTGKKVVTDASVIAQIAADINALPTLPERAVFACPMQLATPTLQLVFASSAEVPAPASTVVTVPSGPGGNCAPGVQVTVHGTAEPQLDNTVRGDLFTQIEKLTGVTAPPVGLMR